jgi:hypothetical protein
VSTNWLLECGHLGRNHEALAVRRGASTALPGRGTNVESYREEHGARQFHHGPIPKAYLVFEERAIAAEHVQGGGLWCVPGAGDLGLRSATVIL